MDAVAGRGAKNRSSARTTLECAITTLLPRRVAVNGRSSRDAGRTPAGHILSLWGSRMPVTDFTVALRFHHSVAGTTHPLNDLDSPTGGFRGAVRFVRAVRAHKLDPDRICELITN